MNNAKVSYNSDSSQRHPSNRSPFTRPNSPEPPQETPHNLSASWEGYSPAPTYIIEPKTPSTDIDLHDDAEEVLTPDTQYRVRYSLISTCTKQNLSKRT